MTRIDHKVIRVQSCHARDGDAPVRCQGAASQGVSSSVGWGSVGCGGDVGPSAELRNFGVRRYIMFVILLAVRFDPILHTKPRDTTWEESCVDENGSVERGIFGEWGSIKSCALSCSGGAARWALAAEGLLHSGHWNDG